MGVRHLLSIVTCRPSPRPYAALKADYAGPRPKQWRPAVGIMTAAPNCTLRCMQPDAGLGGEATAAQPYTTSPGRSRNMRAIRRTGTKPETRLRSALHAQGFRFRKDYALRIDGKLVRPDIAFTRKKVAVFVDGCFWHSCPEHGRNPGVNEGYWSPKLRRNAERDRDQTRLLQNEGWQVVRIWEHVPVNDAVATVVAVLEGESADGGREEGHQRGK